MKLSVETKKNNKAHGEALGSWGQGQLCNQPRAEQLRNTKTVWETTVKLHFVSVTAQCKTYRHTDSLTKFWLVFECNCLHSHLVWRRAVVHTTTYHSSLNSRYMTTRSSIPKTDFPS